MRSSRTRNPYHSLFGVLLSLLSVAFVWTILSTTTAAAQDDKVDVTFIIYTAAGDPFWNPVIHGAEEAAKDRDVALDIQYADQDPVKQNNLIETAIANKVDGIALVNWIPDAFTASIAKARAAGIAVVVFDTDDPKPNATESQAYVGQNFFAAGQSSRARARFPSTIGSSDAESACAKRTPRLARRSIAGLAPERDP